MEIFSDEEIIEGIRSKDNHVVSFVYDSYLPVLRKLVKGNGGTEEDAKDIFQDTLTVVCDNLRESEFKLECSFGTFIYSIWKNLWYKKVNRRQFEYQKIRSYDFKLIEAGWHNNEEKKSFEKDYYVLLHKHVNELDEKCKEILKLHLKDYTYDEICKKLKIYRNDQLRKKKHRCKEKLIRWIKNDPFYKYLIKEDNYEDQ